MRIMLSRAGMDRLMVLPCASSSATRRAGLHPRLSRSRCSMRPPRSHLPILRTLVPGMSPQTSSSHAKSHLGNSEANRPDSRRQVGSRLGRAARPGSDAISSVCPARCCGGSSRRVARPGRSSLDDCLGDGTAYPCGGAGIEQISESCRTRRGMTMIEDHELDYASLARLLDRAVREHCDLVATSDDPLERYRARTNIDFFTAARNAATEHLTRSGEVGRGA